MNLIPNAAGSTPSYFCTWSTQNFGRSDMGEDVDCKYFEGDQGAKNARNFLDDYTVFSENGMINQYDKIREDLFFVFDDGWDVPYNVYPDIQRYRFGSLELSVDRFPSCSGHPAERLKKLNDRVKSFGWRGAGLWVAAQAKGEGRDGFMLDERESENYWRERVKWSREAGIEYWKVDWGERQASFNFREMLSRISREEATGLIIENCRNCGPVNNVESQLMNGDGEKDFRFGSWGTALNDALRTISFSDVLRSYDVSAPLSTSTTIDRVASILYGARIGKEAKGIINCEDEPYIGAALGCSIGIMRSHMFREVPGINYDMRNTRKAIDEAARAVRWQRIAPAFRADEKKVNISDAILTDSWYFIEGDCWARELIGKEIKQACPAVVARGIGLPRVECKSKPPFIVAACNPNGAVSIAALPRIDESEGIHTQAADVELVAGNCKAPIGIFGKFNSITFVFNEPVNGKFIMGQDLIGDNAVNITDRMVFKDNCVTIPGDVIDSIGHMAATPGDISEPGMVLKVL